MYGNCWRHGSRIDEVDLALRMFCYQVRKAIAGMAAALGGLETLVFTGGIGEHAAELRIGNLLGARVSGKLSNSGAAFGGRFADRKNYRRSSSRGAANLCESGEERNSRWTTASSTPESMAPPK